MFQKYTFRETDSKPLVRESKGSKQEALPLTFSFLSGFPLSAFQRPARN